MTDFVPYLSYFTAMSWATVHAAVTQQITTPTSPPADKNGKIDLFSSIGEIKVGKSFTCNMYSFSSICIRGDDGWFSQYFVPGGTLIGWS